MRGFKDGQESTTSLIFDALNGKAPFATIPELLVALKAIAQTKPEPQNMTQAAGVSATGATRGSVELCLIDALSTPKLKTDPAP
jgi:hypothetical protein